MEQPRDDRVSPSRPPSPSGADRTDPTSVGGTAGPGDDRATLDASEVTATGTHPAIAEPPPCVADRHWAVDRVLFAVSAAMALGFVAWGFATPTGLGTVSGSVLGWITGNLGWLFVLLASAFVVFVIWLAAGKYGRIPLGRDDEAPEFRTVSWIAMMFSAGMGIGLMFFGVAEPLSHYVAPPPLTAEPQTSQAIETAMATTLFHWTLHPWAMYAVVGLAIAYGTFRRGRRQLISSAFIPLLGRRRAEGPVGRVIDVLAIFATLFGSAASLGLGALQIGSGVEILGWAGDVGNGDRASFVAKVATLGRPGASAGAVRMVLTPYLLQGHRPGYVDILRHELTHVATARLSAGVPVWLVEGAAEYTGFAHRTASGALDAATTFGRHGLTRAEVGSTLSGAWRPTLEADTGFYSGSEKAVDEHYNSAFITCLYIADRYGEKALRRLYERAAQLAAASPLADVLVATTERAALQHVLHTDRAHLVKNVGAFATRLRHRLVFR